MLDAPAERRILVVDDDPEILDLLATMIATEGHEADTAADGRAALEKIAAREYDLILCDIIMPGLDGAGLYEALQRRWPHLLGRLVFISGYADALDERLRGFIAQNSVPIISKPFKRAQISEAIKGKEF
jgi:CheY-like chemotaxis protein